MGASEDRATLAEHERQRRASRSPAPTYPFVLSAGRWLVWGRTARYVWARVVMENHVGRPLEAGEHVHHIDEDPTNNEITNLRLLSKSAHSLLHQELRRAQRKECPHGHALVEGNIYISPRGLRSCRRCRDEAAKRYEERNPGIRLEIKRRHRERQRSQKAA